jgi:hypothetical protein
MTADTFLFDAGSIFFAAWIAVVAAVTITAFGRDLLSSEAHLDPAKSHSNRPADPRVG